MSRLYITDLDGTLLNKNKEIPEEAKQILNRLIQEEHINFSVATARTPATVEGLLSDVSIDIPVVLMNGATLYDLKNHCYKDVAYIGKEAVNKVLESCEHVIDEGFIYTIKDNELVVYYEDLSRDERYHFFDERKNLQYKKFVKGKPLSLEDVVYFVFMDEENKIKEISKMLDHIPGIAKVMYQDVYSNEDWILEVYSDKATKANGIKKLQALGGYSEIIAFGDNHNDLPMFEIASRAYAVANAVEAAKKAATDIIGSCETSSVAKFIEGDLLK